MLTTEGDIYFKLKLIVQERNLRVRRSHHLGREQTASDEALEAHPEENRKHEWYASLRGKTNLETAVEFLPRPRRPGLSLDHWLRPGPAKTDPFFTGVNNGLRLEQFHKSTCLFPKLSLPFCR